MQPEVDNLFLDYRSWRETNNEFLMHLIKNKSKIISRFKWVIAVVDYLDDKVANEGYKLDVHETEIFEVGYSYIFDRFMTINLIKENIFNNDLFEMEQYAKMINLLLYTIDFEDEIDSLDGDHKKQHDKFANLEDKVMRYIENKENDDDLLQALFAEIDDLSLTVFEGLGVEYYGVTDIFYDIAVDLNLCQEDDDDYFDIEDFIKNKQN